MIKVIPNSQNFETKLDWLTSYHHFSFGEHYDPQKIEFGPLRVFNDDVIKAGSGFDFHSHSNMEIVTLVIDGILEHKDSMGNVGVVEPGEVQRMTAGTGVFHSEYNHSKEKPLRLLQMWVRPDKNGLKPSWEQRKFTKEQKHNKLLAIVHPESTQDDSTSIHQDVWFYVSSLAKGAKISHHTQDRQAYLFVIDGNITVNEKTLGSQNSAEIQKEKEIAITANENSEIILIDLPAT
ncbi:pirin family protein [Candidatus Nitrosotenuis chungbukensis]|uniref:pirin family protein n=1 Tax=Candidatus Nitrosotenuis chungbukensis TaxID=1353246 RepID=UPI0005B2C2DC|nr:pirin family protein [Candidatus Nitrosotenuis chungbukensis]WKT57077.1 pirin family protein [Candidatus Nitrosotenuis chungbukensis]